MAFAAGGYNHATACLAGNTPTVGLGFCVRLTESVTR